MRIGLICPYSLTIPGGVQGQVLGLARALRRRGHEAWVLSPSDGPPPETGVIPLGNSIPTASNGSVAPIAPDVSCALRTIRALRDEEFDVLHLHEPLVPGPTETALLLRGAGIPMVGTFHASGQISWYDRVRPLVRWGASQLAVRVAVSDEAARQAAESLGGTYVPLFNGIEVRRFRAAEPHPTDGPTIFFVGRHEPRKGLRHLIDAHRRLAGDVVLWVAGDGPETEELKAATATDDRVHWLGRVSDAELASRLKGADVFCAPSLGGESFGVVLLEAMAAATPIVATDIDGYRQVARADRDAVLVPPENPEALADALDRVLYDGDLRTRLVASGGERAERYSMTRLADEYLGIYESLSPGNGHLH